MRFLNQDMPGCPMMSPEGMAGIVKKAEFSKAGDGSKAIPGAKICCWSRVVFGTRHATFLS